MKKIIIYSILVFIFMFYTTGAEAVQVNTGSASAVKSAGNTSEITVYETSQIKIFKKANKFGVWDKKNKQYIVKPVLDGISKFAKNNDFEYKIKSDEMIGYMNLVTKDTFLSNFDDIYIIDNKYLKVRKNEKFGITDKKGKVIIPAEYERVCVTQYDGTEYFIGKSEKKYNVFYNDGRIVSGSDFRSIDKTTYGSSVVRNLNPALKEYRETLKDVQAGVETAYITETVVLDTEIQELPIPTMARNTETGDVQPKIYKKSSIVSTNYSPEMDSVIEVAKYPIPTMVRKITVKTPDYSPIPKEKNKEQNQNIAKETYKDNDALEVITLNKKSYYIVSHNGKLGLQTRKGKELIPPQYKMLKIKKVNSNEIIAAVNDNGAKLYNAKGDVMAKRYQGKINVYTPMRKYEYNNLDNIYMVSFNNKKIGEVEVFDDGTYEYKRYGFNISNMKKANEIFAALISAEQK